jgi:hypothetical protein
MIEFRLLERRFGAVPIFAVEDGEDRLPAEADVSMNRHLESEDGV